MELELFCVHGQEKCVSLTQKPGSHQRRGPGAGCGSAAIVVLPHQGELGQLELLCVHRQTNAFSWHKNQGHIKKGTYKTLDPKT